MLADAVLSERVDFGESDYVRHCSGSWILWPADRRRILPTCSLRCVAMGLPFARGPAPARHLGREAGSIRLAARAPRRRGPVGQTLDLLSPMPHSRVCWVSRNGLTRLRFRLSDAPLFIAFAMLLQAPYQRPNLRSTDLHHHHLGRETLAVVSCVSRQAPRRFRPLSST